MYKKITPYWRDNQLWFSVQEDEKMPKEKQFWKKGEPRLLNLSIVRQIVPLKVIDGSIKLSYLEVSENSVDNIIVSEKEAEEIKAILLASDKDTSKDALATEVSRLAKCVRDLHELLRARLH